MVQLYGSGNHSFNSLVCWSAQPILYFVGQFCRPRGLDSSTMYPYLLNCSNFSVFVIHERRGTSFLWRKRMVCFVNSVNGSFHSSHFRMSWRFVFRCFIVRVKKIKKKNGRKRRRRLISSKLSGEAVRAQQSRALALAGCDCSERQRRRSFHALRTLFFLIF